ncbi:hypothetical protein ID875_32725 [Streptomyces globisporus]|uniref:DUF2637 domain-containing protein n=1 Tax=Streptomyces globisporus TaxID=1908 RepID=A0A927GQA0_STRGL|nr:hypothetical protein [Streptomyces globisporus]
MSTYREERRADAAAQAEREREDRRLEVEAQLKAREIKAEQQRANAAAAEERKAARQREADERAARLAKQARSDKQAAKKAKQAARAERRAARQKALTPGNVYRTGTLALVTASALGSMPAQILHFADMSAMLLPLPFAIEGAAWVMAAGVAYADERGLPGWVRWALRALVLAAAGFAASINYGYGKSIEGLSEADQTTAGIGLAAVSLLGPLLFEVRQWSPPCRRRPARPRRRSAGGRRRRRKPRAGNTSRVAGRTTRTSRWRPTGCCPRCRTGRSPPRRRSLPRGGSRRVPSRGCPPRSTPTTNAGSRSGPPSNWVSTSARSWSARDARQPLQPPPRTPGTGHPDPRSERPGPCSQRSSEGATALAGIGMYGSEGASEKARENATQNLAGTLAGTVSVAGPTRSWRPCCRRRSRSPPSLSRRAPRSPPRSGEAGRHPPGRRPPAAGPGHRRAEAQVGRGPGRRRCGGGLR